MWQLAQATLYSLSLQIYVENSMEVMETNNHLCAWDLFKRHCEKEIEFERMSHKFYAKYIFKCQSFLVVLDILKVSSENFWKWGKRILGLVLVIKSFCGTTEFFGEFLGWDSLMKFLVRFLDKFGGYIV